jgi:hypothetical protein
MLVHNLSRVECHEVLARAPIWRLACAKEGQPYIIPVHLVFDFDYLYGLATRGRKIEWMRANPLVCVEVEELGPEERQWTSVLVFGLFEEVTRTPEHDDARRRAETLLAGHEGFWWPATTKSAVRERSEPVLYRIRISRMTGRRASRR